MDRFLRESAAYLNPGGLIAMEFGIGQAETLRLLAEDLGYDPVEIQSDIGGIERFLFATKSA
jgi:methylase of polypeptide subunit release factors